MRPQKVDRLKKTLEAAELKFLKNKEIESDAIAPALKYLDVRDREFAALICAVLAYGKVAHIKGSVERLLAPLGPKPVSTLLKLEASEINKKLSGWKHRFNTTSDAIHLLLLLKSIYEKEGSIESFACEDKFLSVRDLLENFVSKIEVRLMALSIKPNKSFWFFFSKPSSGSACKRLNLYLRWMAGTGPFDLKLWTKVPEEILMIPLDVHLLNQARSLRLTARKQADWKTVEEVTNKLKLLDEKRPTRFDFALCHLGITGRILTTLLAAFVMSCQAQPPKPEEQNLKAPIVVRRAPLTHQDEDRFLRAIKDDDVNQVHFFISVGADLNKNYKFPGALPETPLLAAIESRSRKSIRLLLDSGAKTDALEDPNNSELIAAILSRQELVALELTEKGNNVCKVLKDTGETALMSAARIGYASVVTRLVERGCPVNFQNEDGYTALMYAAEFGCNECVERLLNSGADPKLRNKAKRTAGMISSSKLRSELKKRL